MGNERDNQVTAPLYWYTAAAWAHLLHWHTCLIFSTLPSREIFSVLDLMKMDMANFAVSYIRPHLMKQSVEYERSKFQEFLDRHPSEGLLSLFLRYIFTVFFVFFVVRSARTWNRLHTLNSGQWREHTHIWGPPLLYLSYQRKPFTS